MNQPQLIFPTTRKDNQRDLSENLDDVPYRKNQNDNTKDELYGLGGKVFLQPCSAVYPEETPYPKKEAQPPVRGYGQASVGIDGGHEGIKDDPRNGRQERTE